MNDYVVPGAYGWLSEPATLKIQRRMPGTVERVWAYLTESDLRRQWLAAGDMDLHVGVPFELIGRNDTLTDPPGQRPARFAEVHRMDGHIVELDPPRKLVISWHGTGDVSFELEQHGKDVLLTVIHRGLPDRETMLEVSAGWHSHLDVLVARILGARPQYFWDGWERLKQDYNRRLPASASRG